MRPRYVPFRFLLLVLMLPPAGRHCYAQSEHSKNWPQFRGPDGTGASQHAQPPVEWSETKNVRWKVELDGLGHSSPVVWNDRIYVTFAVPFGERFGPLPDTAPGAHDNLLVSQKHRYAVQAIDRTTGSTVWEKTVHQRQPHEGGHYTGSLASQSPVTDGRLVIAFFGSAGLYALDPEGEVVWEKMLGQMNTKHGHGEGSSPALFGDTLIVNWDHEGESFVVALNKNTGDELWRQLRQEVTSWSSPIITQIDGRNQVVVCGTNRIRSYDLETGDIIWECGGLSANVVATPIAQDGIVFAASSYETRAMLAINAVGATGDITDSDRVVWRRERGTPYVPSPLLYRDTI